VAIRPVLLDLDAIRGSHTPTSARSARPRWDCGRRGRERSPAARTACAAVAGLPGHPHGKNPGDVWRIDTRGFRGAHFATFRQSWSVAPSSPPAPPWPLATAARPGDPLRAGTAARLDPPAGLRPHPGRASCATRSSAPALSGWWRGTWGGTGWHRARMGLWAVLAPRHAQQSNTDQQISFRNRWSSSTSSRIASGSWLRCHWHSSRPAASASPSGAAARAALIA
jgi:hypothetical protein